MIKQKEHFHGSDLEKIEAVFGIKKEAIVSFSANVNPLGISGKLKETLSQHLDVITSYPDREYTALRKCIGSYTGADADHILVGNGSTELISLLIQMRQPKHALLLGPTYSEYGRELALAHAVCSDYFLREEQDFQLDLEDFLDCLKEDMDLLIICNPNNPTSTAIPRSQMEQIVKACRALDIFVMIDETYVEFAPDYEELTAVPLTKAFDNLIVLRGISKFFAAPGLRLGYAITSNEALIAHINTHKNPWTINSLAEVAGTLMFSDQEYIRQTKELISRERERICRQLKALDTVKIYPASANFVLVKIKKEGVTSQMLFEHAIRRGLMIRDCSTFPGFENKFIRFCFMSEADNDRLLKCLKELL